MRREKSFFQLVKQVHPLTSRPWFITEIYVSSDGLRSRFCDGRYQTEEDARVELKKREER